MGTTYMNFGTGVFHVDSDAPLTQAQVDSVWRNLPTTGASWVERGHLFVQQFDGAKTFNLGPVEHGVKGVSHKVSHMTRKSKTRKSKKKKKTDKQLEREINSALARKVHQSPTGREVFAAHERHGHITTAGRRALARSQFALPPGPEERRRGFKGRLPIDTLGRAHDALARASMMHHNGHLSARQLAQVRSKVHKMWPSIKLGY